MRRCLAYDQDNRCSGLFSKSILIAAQPFTEWQMRALFRQIESLFPFSASLKKGIMTYSSREPFVFGSIVRFAMDMHYSLLPWLNWEVWFTTDGLWTFCADYDACDKAIRKKLRTLSAFE